MAIITLTAQQFADKLRVFECVQVPVAVGGFVYMVVRGQNDENIYRVAIA